MTTHPTDEVDDVDTALATCRTAWAAWRADPENNHHLDAYATARRQLHRARRHAIALHTAYQPQPSHDDLRVDPDPNTGPTT